MRIKAQKNPHDTLQEELQKERAAVLGRAGELLAAAIAKLQTTEADINKRLCRIDDLMAKSAEMPADRTLIRQRQRAILEINGEIDRYNQLREHAKLRYYYLIVTREAMGLRKHDRVREIYGIPDRKGHLRADCG